jgi:hypothetical protein
MARLFWLVAIGPAFCFSLLARAAEPAGTVAVMPQQVRTSIDRAIGYLQRESATWLKTRKCAACHHAPLPLWALSEADRQGYATDKKFVAETLDSILGSPEKLISSKLFNDPADPPDTRPIGKGVRTGAAFMAVAARSFHALDEGQKQSLQLIVKDILEKQRDDGSWEFFLSRPPINENATTDVAWIIMALGVETDLKAPEPQRAAIARATAWLEGKTPETHQDKVFKVLLAARGGHVGEKTQKTIDEIFGLQRPDGGWSQTVPELKSDAFATGQTLYVLSRAGYQADRPEIMRAFDFLVATQAEDGSWPMISRSTPDGSPGSSKLLSPITCAASSWATLGLASLVPQGN